MIFFDSRGGHQRPGASTRGFPPEGAANGCTQQNEGSCYRVTPQSTLRHRVIRTMRISRVAITASTLSQGRWAFATCVSICLVLSLGASSRATPTSGAFETHIANSSAALQRFAASHSFADLRTAADEMGFAGDVNEFKPQTFIAQRRTLVRGWANVIRAIEQSYDPTYDPNDPANRLYWGLPDPQSIQDPKVRASAVAALAANQRNIERSAYHRQVWVLDRQAQTGLHLTLDLLRKVEPDGTPSDFAALDGILQQAGISSARRAKIDAMFYARPNS
jgi:hypothetical protein